MQTLCPKNWNSCIQKKIMVLSMLKSSPIELIHFCERLGVNNAIPLQKQSMQEEETMANWIETNMPMTLDKVWPGIEAALTGRSKDQTSPLPAKKPRLCDPSAFFASIVMSNRNLTLVAKEQKIVISL